MNEGNFIEIGRIIVEIVGVASMIAAATPNKKDDKYIGWITRFIHALAFNFGKARNAE